MDKPTKPTDLMPRTFGGLKENYSASLQQTGVEPNVPVIYHGKNFNYEKNAIGQELDYCEKIVDFINGIPIGKTITVDSNNKLQYADLAQEVPIATTETAGIVKPDGETITVDENGVVTAKSMSRNIGEIVVSTIPLTDAGLHLLDGSLIQGNGSYSAFVDYIANLYENTQVSGYKYNINTIGSLTNNNGVLSGFSTSKYAQIVQQVPLASANSFEFVFKFNYNTPTAMQSIFAERNVAYFSQVSIDTSGKLYCQLSNNHTSVNIGSGTGSTTLTNGNTYYVKLSFDGSAYKIYLSSTGEFSGEESEEISITSSAQLLNFNWNIGCSALASYEQPFTQGSIDLKESYININGQRWWTGAEEIKSMFCTEAQWQTSVTQYGVCGKFVYNSVNNTVRLPKYNSKIYTGGGTAPVVGNGKTLGLTDGASNYGLFANLPGQTGSNLTAASDLYGKNIGTALGSGSMIPRNIGLGITMNADNSGLIAQLSSITTSLDGYYYIVIATSTKTDIQVDIDEIATDLNGKADVDLTNVNNAGTSRGASWAMPSDTYDDLTLGASGTTYTAPANGWFVISKISGIANTYLTMALNMEDGVTALRQIQQTSPLNTARLTIFFPVLKGDSVTVTYGATGATQYFRFMYAVGSESEAQ